MRKIIFTSLILFWGLFGYGQNEFKNNKSYFGNILWNGRSAINLQYSYNELHWFNVGYVRGWRCHYDSPCDDMVGVGSMVYHYYNATLGGTFYKDKFLFRSQIGYSLSFICVDLGVNLVSYTDFGKVYGGVSPKIGLTLGGIATLYYARDFLIQAPVFPMNNNQIGLSFIIGSKIFRTYKDLHTNI